MFTLATFVRTLAVLGLLFLVSPANVKAEDQSPSQDPMVANLLCRRTIGAEIGNAKMIQDSVLLVCRPIAINMRMSDGSMKTIGSVSANPISGPNFSNPVSPARYQEAYNTWVERTFHIDGSP